MADMAEETQEGAFHIPFGAMLKLKIDGILIPVEIKSQLVGMLKDEYLLITHPTPLATTKPKLFPGNRVIAQYQSGDTVVVFGVQIKAFLLKPIRVVVLEYPDKVLRRKLRAES